jgi:uncharacterized PurR-regulated membrane protein YhhQ (DUF165 family)
MIDFIKNIFNLIAFAFIIACVAMAILYFCFWPLIFLANFETMSLVIEIFWIIFLGSVGGYLIGQIKE